MAEKKDLHSELESIALESSLIDFSLPEETENIFNGLESLASLFQKEGMSNYNDMLSSARAAYGDSAGTEERQKVLAYTISFFQNISAEISKGNVPEYDKSRFENELHDFVSGEANLDNARERLSENPALVEDFTQNVSQTLDEIEALVLEIEKKGAQTEKVHSVFRAFHTIKSEAHLLSLSAFGNTAHRIEDLLASVREKKIRCTESITTFLLHAVDAFTQYLELLASDKEKALTEDFGSLLRELDALTQKEEVSEPETPEKRAEEKKEVPSSEEKEHTPAEEAAPDGFTPEVPEIDLSEGTEMLTEFIDEAEEHLANAEDAILTLENNPEDDEAVNCIFRAFHTIKGVSGFFNFNDIKTLAHTSETMLDLVRKRSLSFDATVADATLVSIDHLRSLLTLLNEQAANEGKLESGYLNIGPQLLRLERIIKSEPPPPEKKDKKIGEIMIEESMITPGELDQALLMQEGEEKEKRIGEILKNIDAVSAKDVSTAVKTQAKKIDSSIKINVEKLDTLINLVGELVICETQVVQSKALMHVQERRLMKDLSELDRITRTLQGAAMNMRLVPVKPTFQKMTRIVRDLCRKSNKEINVVLNGEETEIDKNMVETVSDPLIHMVRNAADHGIESREERIARGKNPVGTVTLSACHKGGNVVIEIADDGGGLSKEKIMKKAAERGIINPDEQLSDKRIWSLIFEPGFSTASQVTDVSGRGVGMDVVRKNIEQLRGRIEIESEEGKGSCFSIHLPLTLAIIEGIVLRLGRERYILPIHSVVEFLSPRKERFNEVVGRGKVYSFHDEVIPFIRIDRLFNVDFSNAELSDKILCVFDSEYGRYCMAVDEVIGQQQVVIKSLGERLQELKGVSGGTILGDGRVGLILDANGIVEYSREPQETA